MALVNEVRLPGVGIRYEFETADGARVGVIHHRSGERELVAYEPDDPDTCRELLRLGPEESRILAELLGVSQIAKELVELQQNVEGLAIDWLLLQPNSPFAGRTIGDTGARTRTGVSIVAVLRGETPFPAPGPEFALEGGDTLVVVGTPRGIEQLVVLLRSG